MNLSQGLRYARMPKIKGNEEELSPEQLKELIESMGKKEPLPREIFLYEDITDRAARRVCEDLVELAKESQEPITIFINSPGGDVTAGLAIIDIMNTIPCPIITVISGEACSMGSIISICGDTRLMTKHSYWMMHPMRGGVYDNMTTCNDRIKFMDILAKDLVEIYKNKTKLPKALIKKYEENGEMWLNAEDCVKYGIVDDVIPFSYNRTKQPKQKAEVKDGAKKKSV